MYIDITVNIHLNVYIYFYTIDIRLFLFNNAFNGLNENKPVDANMLFSEMFLFP